jgi:Zn-dependent peptidase ImmA (M78 family)/transcriptional regulator with XRE-family HTH domain
MARAANINPDILVWARESAGLSVEDAAHRLGITSSETTSAAEKLEEFESGERFPTRNQLTKFSSVYRRPLITFYMKQPPQRGARGEDFRTLPFDVPPRENAKLDALLRDIRARQEMVKSILEDEDDTSPLPFVGSASVSDGVQAVVTSIAKTLGLDLNQQGRSGNADDLFRELRYRTERAGVFVLLVGDLGSHHSAIRESVFRGFAIADPIAPFVVINDQDAKAARSFTLLHELAHIWLGQTGVSGTPDDSQVATPTGRIEQFCNDVAGEILLPSHALRAKPEDWKPGDKDAVSAFIRRIADAWSVSEPMVAYRLHRMSWITGAVYRQLTADFAARWHAIKQKDKEKAKESEGGPSYYTVKQFKLGNALIDVVRRTLRNNELTYTKAAKVLGVKPSSVEPLLSRYEGSRGMMVPDPRG